MAVIQAYSYTNNSGFYGQQPTADYPANGQSFLNNSANYMQLDSCQFRVYFNGAPAGSGLIWAELYPHTGTFGTSSGNGQSFTNPLATSNKLLQSQMPTSQPAAGTAGMVQFTFSGPETERVLNPNTNYIIVLRSTVPDLLWVSVDSSAPTSSGNAVSIMQGNTGAATSTLDFIHSVDGTVTTAAPANPAASTDTGWYHNDWKYRVKVTINSNWLTPNVTQPAFYLRMSDLPSHFHFNVASEAADVRMTLADGITEIPIEIVTYDPATNTGEMYYRKTDAYTTGNIVTYLYYGNKTAAAPSATSTYGRNAVWTNYSAVWHFGAAGFLSTTDSTGGGRTLTNTGVSAADGKLTTTGGAAAVVDNADKFTFTRLVTGTTYTMEWWTRLPLANTNPNWNTMFRDTVAPGDHHVIVQRTDNVIGMYDNNTGTGFRSFGVDLDSFPQGNAWAHFTVTADGTTSRLYINGILQGSVAKVASGGVDVMGNYQLDGQAWGTIDEVRITAGAARPAGWISTSHNIQNSPSSIYTINTNASKPNAASGNMLMMFQ